MRPKHEEIFRSSVDRPRGSNELLERIPSTLAIYRRIVCPLEQVDNRIVRKGLYTMGLR